MRKRSFFRLFFTAEVLVFSWFYFYGAQGVFAVAQIGRENKDIEEKIKLIRNDIAELQSTIVAWQSDSFYKEKIARENLQMAKVDEQVYFTS